MPEYSEYPLGIDVSFYQGVNDWDKIASRVKFAFIRAGQNNFTDIKFTQNWKASQDKLPRGAYWFYDWRTTGQSTAVQGNAFKALLNPVGELWPVMDFENPYQGWSTTPFPGRSAALDIILRFRDAVGSSRMILYINSSTLKTLQPFPSWLTDEFDLWIAAYPLIEDPKGSGKWRMVRSPDEIPVTWVPATYGWEWSFWQFTSKLPGILYGVGSGDLDGNLFNGDDAALRLYSGFGKRTDSEKVDIMWTDFVIEHPEYAGA